MGFLFDSNASKACIVLRVVSLVGVRGYRVPFGDISSDSIGHYQNALIVDYQ